MHGVVQATFDDRERELVAAFKAVLAGLDRAADFPITVTRLPLGDVQLVGEGGVRVLVERKRDDDLMASLFDGRLEEQSARLGAWCAADDRHWVVVLVENHHTNQQSNINVPWHRHFLKTLVQEQAGALRRPRRLCLRTTGPPESALLLLTLWKTLTTHHGSDTADLPLVLPPPPRRHGSTYVRQLACVPGISPARARLIAERYPGGVAALCAAAATDAALVHDTLTGIINNRPAVTRLLQAVMTGTADAEGGANAVPKPHRKRPRNVHTTRRTICSPVEGAAATVPDSSLPPPADGLGASGAGAPHHPPALNAEPPVLSVSPVW